MASASSLLRSASATRKKIRSYEDSVAKFEWDISAKTEADYADYATYIQTRAGEASDPSEILGYQRSMVTARRSFASHEIQRQSIEILEGRGTSIDKYGVMANLYAMAVSNQDLDLAQSLRQQLDTLDIKIQSERESAANTARTLATNGIRATENAIADLEDKIQNGTDDIQLPDGTFLRSAATLKAEFEANGDTQFGVFSELDALAKGSIQILTEAYNGLTTQESVDKFEEKYGGYFDGTRFFKAFGKDFTLEKIAIAKAAEDANNPLYSVSSKLGDDGKMKFELNKNEVDDFVWTVQPDPETGGQKYVATKTRTIAEDKLQSLGTQITDKGEIIGADGSILAGEGKAERDSALSLENRLNNLGYQVTTTKDGEIQITVPGVGLVSAKIGPDLNVRFFGQQGEFSGIDKDTGRPNPGMFEIDAITGQIREVSPDETSDFGVRSEFGGFLSDPTQAGASVLNQLSGVTQTSQELFKATTINTVNSLVAQGQTEFSGATVPVFGANLQGSTGVLGAATLLQGANKAAEDKAVADALEIQAKATALQANQTFNVNQTPVRNVATSGAPVKQLTVQKATAPTLSGVSVAQPKQKITSTSVATPSRRITGVVNAAPRGTLRVQ